MQQRYPLHFDNIMTNAFSVYDHNHFRRADTNLKPKNYDLYHNLSSKVYYAYNYI